MHAPGQEMSNLEDSSAAAVPVLPGGVKDEKEETSLSTPSIPAPPPASRRCGVAVSAFFSVIFNLWRWLFTLLGGG